MVRLRNGLKWAIVPAIALVALTWYAGRDNNVGIDEVRNQAGKDLENAVTEIYTGNTFAVNTGAVNTGATDLSSIYGASEPAMDLPTLLQKVNAEPKAYTPKSYTPDLSTDNFKPAGSIDGINGLESFIDKNGFKILPLDNDGDGIVDGYTSLDPDDKPVYSLRTRIRKETTDGNGTTISFDDGIWEEFREYNEDGFQTRKNSLTIFDNTVARITTDYGTDGRVSYTMTKQNGDFDHSNYRPDGNLDYSVEKDGDTQEVWEREDVGPGLVFVSNTRAKDGEDPKTEDILYCTLPQFSNEEHDYNMGVEFDHEGKAKAVFVYGTVKGKFDPAYPSSYNRTTSTQYWSLNDQGMILYSLDPHAVQEVTPDGEVKISETAFGDKMKEITGAGPNDFVGMPYSTLALFLETGARLNND